MLSKHSVEGFEAFQAKVEALAKDDKPLFVYFSGSKTASGQSWCPYCVTAQPIVEATLENLTANYLYVGVGERGFWKDPNCIFRTSPLTKLRSVPTLFRWGASQNRLEEGQCTKPDLITMLLED